MENNDDGGQKTLFGSNNESGAEKPLPGHDSEQSSQENKSDPGEGGPSDSGPTEGQKPQDVKTSKNYGKKNTFFTEDRAAKARALLKKKLSGNQLNSGIDPEIIMAGMELAGYHIEAGARSFVDYSARMVSDLGEGIKPFLKSFYSAVRNYPGFDSKGMNTEKEVDQLIEEGAGDVPSSTADTERNSKSIPDENQNREEDISSGPGRSDQSPGRTGGRGRRNGTGSQRPGPSGSEQNATSDSGTGRNNQVHNGNEPTGSQSSTSRPQNSDGGSNRNENGESPDPERTETTGKDSGKPPLKNVKFKWGDADSIAHDVPQLFPEQQGDVLFA